MIEKRTIIDKIDILRDGHIWIQERNQLIEYDEETGETIDDGVEVAATFHRDVLYPDRDITSRSDYVKSLAALVWTNEIIDKYKAKIAIGGKE